MNVYSVWYDSSQMFRQRGYTVVKDPHDADILILNGGEDIATGLYGEQPIDNGWSPEYPTKRDETERKFAEFGFETGKFMFGICRGAQLLNVLNGGKMWQHVNAHGNDHELLDLITGERLITTSVHHQMMIPTPEAEIIAVASESTRKYRQHEQIEVKRTGDLRDGQDPEIIWYPKTRSLCIQGHPEYHLKSFTDYCFTVLDRCLAGEQAAQSIAV